MQGVEEEDGEGRRCLTVFGKQGTTSLGQALCVGFYLCEGIVKESSAVQWRNPNQNLAVLPICCPILSVIVENIYVPSTKHFFPKLIY